MKQNYCVRELCLRREPSNVEDNKRAPSFIIIFFYFYFYFFFFFTTLARSSSTEPSPLMNVYSVKYSWNSPFLDDLFPSFESSASNRMLPSNRCSPFSSPNPSLPPPSLPPSLPPQIFFYREVIIYQRIENILHLLRILSILEHLVSREPVEIIGYWMKGGRERY